MFTSYLLLKHLNGLAVAQFLHNDALDSYTAHLATAQVVNTCYGGSSVYIVNACGILHAKMNNDFAILQAAGLTFQNIGWDGKIIVGIVFCCEKAYIAIPISAPKV